MPFAIANPASSVRTSQSVGPTFDQAPKMAAEKGRNGCAGITKVDPSRQRCRISSVQFNQRFPFVVGGVVNERDVLEILDRADRARRLKQSRRAASIGSGATWASRNTVGRRECRALRRLRDSVLRDDAHLIKIVGSGSPRAGCSYAVNRARTETSGAFLCWDLANRFSG